MIANSRESDEMDGDDPDKEYEPALGKLKHVKKLSFLAAFAKTGGSIIRAAKAAGVSRNSHYHWIKADPVYQEAFADARHEIIETLEAECDRRGRDGYEEPVFYQGEQCGTIRKFSDTLLIFRLKALCPAAYRDNQPDKLSHKDVDAIIRGFVQELSDTCSPELRETLRGVLKRIAERDDNRKPSYGWQNPYEAKEDQDKLLV
jgi:hypothetical protein